jgi:hypothetical protein
MDKQKLEDMIKAKLKDTQKCKFKTAWIPKGWACVYIDTFTKELAEIIKKGDKTW